MDTDDSGEGLAGLETSQPQKAATVPTVRFHYTLTLPSPTPPPIINSSSPSVLVSFIQKTFSRHSEGGVRHNKDKHVRMKQKLRAGRGRET